MDGCDEVGRDVGVLGFLGEVVKNLLGCCASANHCVGVGERSLSRVLIARPESSTRLLILSDGFKKFSGSFIADAEVVVLDPFVLDSRSLLVDACFYEARKNPGADNRHFLRRHVGAGARSLTDGFWRFQREPPARRPKRPRLYGTVFMQRNMSLGDESNSARSNSRPGNIQVPLGPPAQDAEDIRVPLRWCCRDPGLFGEPPLPGERQYPGAPGGRRPNTFEYLPNRSKRAKSLDLFGSSSSK